MSRALAECVRAPTLIRSTPVSAIGRTVCKLTPPDASSFTRTSPCPGSGVGSSPQTRTSSAAPCRSYHTARMIASLTEEAEAINWYEQRMSVEADREARAIMANAQKEEFKHFGMDLEFLIRRKPDWRTVLQDILFQPGDIVAHGEEAEEAENDAW